jgi:DNA-binding response OmpR family regulator
MKMKAPGHEMVLIVEDDEDTAESLRDAIGIMGHASEIAGNGKVALEYLRRDPTKYCLILLDLAMPVMNGWDFLNEHHRDSTISSVPVIIVTAILKVHAKVAAEDAAEFLQKPVDTGRLKAALGHYC